MHDPVTPSIAHQDMFLILQMDMIFRFEAAASALKNAWGSLVAGDPMDDHLYWGAWAARREACVRWGELQACGRLPFAHSQNRMWLAAKAAEQGGAQ